MAWVAGVDGCRAGWVVALVEQRPTGMQFPQIKLYERFEDVLSLSPATIAVDIPIGLLDAPQPGGRDCDRQARKLLGHPRGSSVFSPPCRKFWDAKAFSDVQGMSIQTFSILPKIREVDGLMSPTRQKIVHEAHPELAFMSLAGQPMRFNKKKPQGRKERLRALENAGLAGIEQAIEKEITAFTRKEVARDDLLDAYVLAWVALRIAGGKEKRVPADPPIDRKGLRMEIWY